MLIDPFGVVHGHREQFPKTHLPDADSASYNPLDFIREDDGLAVRDINVLLDALLTPPRPDAHQNSLHFYESARAIVAGYMAWVRFKEPLGRRTLKTLYEMLSAPPEAREGFADAFRKEEPFAGGLARLAVERQAQVGKEEGGSTFTTIANQLAFLNFPELAAHTQTSSFDPLILADGDTDLFVVAPEETIEHVKGWLRLWVAIPNAVAGIRPLKRDLLIVIDEMPRLGYLKPVMDGYTMAAGKGVHFWCFAQSISALDSTWGTEHRKTLLHLAELVQILGFPRTDAEGAEEMSKAIGTVTFEARTESRSGTISESDIVTANTQWQAGESLSLVRERLVTPDELMTLGPDRQYVIAAPKDMPRDALHSVLAAKRRPRSRRSQSLRAAQATRPEPRRTAGLGAMAPVRIQRRTNMTMNKPGMAKRAVHENGAGGTGPDNAVRSGPERSEQPANTPNGTDRKTPVLEEILGILRVIEVRSEEHRGGQAGLSKQDIDRFAQTVEAVGESIRETRPLLERLAAQNPANETAMKAAAGLTKAMRTHRAEFGRWVGAERRARWRWSALALAAAVPAALLFGVLIEQQFQVIPLHDSSGGWRELIWHEYGRQIAECAVEARRIDAKVNCPLVVTKPPKH